MSNKNIHIKRIYTLMKQYNILPKSDTINVKQINEDLKYLNLLVIQTIQIVSNKKLLKNDKITHLSKLKNPQGKPLFTKAQWIMIYKRFYPQLIAFSKQYSTGLNRNKKNIKGGQYPVEYYSNNAYDRAITDTINRISSLPIIEWINKFNEDYDVTGNTQDTVSSLSNFVFEWLFFGLYKLENLPVLGPFVEIGLDFSDVLLNNVDIFIEFLVPILVPMLNVTIDIAEGIPELGTILALIGIPISILEGPFFYLMENFTDIIGLFINVQRKQWSLAYLNALEVFPQLPSIMTALITQMALANKYIDRSNKYSIVIKDKLDEYKPLYEPFLNEPCLLTNPMKILNDVVIPNKNIIPFADKLPLDTLEIYKNKVQKYTDAYNSFMKGDINKYLKNKTEY